MEIITYLMIGCGIGIGFCWASYHWVNRIKEIREKYNKEIVILKSREAK